MDRRLFGLVVGLLALSSCEGGTDPTPPPENLVGPDGGTVLAEGLTVTVPPGALGTEVEITVDRVTLSPGMVPEGFVVVDGTGFDLGPDGLTFQQPVELVISYDGGSVPAGFSAGELEVLHVEGGVTRLASTVDPAAGEVRASTDHFSTFAVGLAEGPYERVACPAFEPASSAGVPLDRVALGSVPGEFEPPLLARVETGDDAPPSYGIVHLDDGGAAELVVPIHPSTSPEGGGATLIVTDGMRSCAPFDFTIEPLEPAPGELDAVAGHLQAILREQAAVLGTTPEELVSTPVAEMPPALYPLALTQSTLDHPANERSLTALARGTAPDADAARLDLVEPLMARTGLRAELGAAVARLRAAHSRPSVASTTSLSPPSGPSGVIEPGLCTPKQIGDDAGLLDHCMGLARDAALEQVNPTGQILDDLSTAFGALGLAPGVGTAADVLGFALWLTLNQSSRNAALLPSFLTGMTLEPDPVEFLEDQAGPGTWHANVTAANAGWDMGKEILKGLLEAAKFAGVFDKAQIGGPELNDVLGYILTGPVADDLIEGATIEDFQIEAETYGPVFVTPEEWTESRIALGEAVELVSHDEYEPRKRGTATLAVRTVEGTFGGQQATAEEEVTVDELQVAISPAEVHLKARESQDFTVTVRDSKHPEMVELDESVTLQGSVGEIAYVGEGLHIVSYTAPTDPDAETPDLLTVRHSAETGARGHSTEERRATATIRFAEITVSPTSACVEPGETHQFSADVQGLDDESVVWTASAGAIDDNGLFTAPEEIPSGGAVIITATSTSEPDISDSVAVDIGMCNLCRYDVALSGGFGGVSQGPANFVLEDGGLEIGIDGAFAEGATGDRISGGVVTAPWDGGTDTYVITEASVVNHDNGGFAWFHPHDESGDCPSCGGTLTIDEASEETVSGSFEVTMPTFAEQGEEVPPTTAVGTFRAWLHVPGDPLDPYGACLTEWEGM